MSSSGAMTGGSIRRTGATPRLSDRSPGQRGLDERLDVAIEHALHVADLDPCPVVLHQRVGMEHVAPDLAAPVGRAHLPPLLRLLRLLLEHALLDPPPPHPPHPALP